LWAGLAAGLIVTSAASAAVTPYKVPKEKGAAAKAPAAAPAEAREGVTWTVPAGWEEAPAGQIRLGSFRIKGKDGGEADVSIIPLPGMAGGDLENVNRWRGQVGLAPVSQEELTKLTEKLDISGEPAQLYDMSGQAPGVKTKGRILAAIQRRQGTVFFYKMAGEDNLVAAQKANFVGFLKSVKFGPAAEGALPAAPRPLGADLSQTALPASHPPIDGLPPSHPPIGMGNAGAGLPASHPPIEGLGAAGASAAGQTKPAWKIPAGWQELPPGQMQLAKYALGAKDAPKAEVSVATIPGDGGGALANVNRWRRQIGLGPIEESALAKETSSLEIGASKALVLDAVSSDKARRMVVVSVPVKGSTWFYKLLGDEAAVAKEKEAFLGFVKSAP